MIDSFTRTLATYIVGLSLLYNPPGNGNHQFEAQDFWLNRLGIYHSALANRKKWCSTLKITQTTGKACPENFSLPFPGASIYSITHPKSFNHTLMRLLKNLCPLGNILVIMGDFNIDLLKCTSSLYSHDFLSSLQSCFLVPTINKPTRVRSTSTTLIDNIFIKIKLWLVGI